MTPLLPTTNQKYNLQATISDTLQTACCNIPLYHYKDDRHASINDQHKPNHLSLSVTPLSHCACPSVWALPLPEPWDIFLSARQLDPSSCACREPACRCRTSRAYFHVHMALRLLDASCCDTILVMNRHVSTELHEHPCHICTTDAGCEVQRGPPVLVMSRHVGAMLHEHLRHVYMNEAA